MAPFLEFLAYLIPNEADRKSLCAWIATLIGRPKVRMGYGVLLASEKQGVGKSTLGNVLAQLVGPWNVSHPSESDIAGKYTGWLANKRLVQVEEIYQGHSFATANRLKSLITEKHVRVEEKYQAAYEIENWAHFFATSNSMRPLKMAESERRWFVPGVTEEVWDQAKFRELHDWLECDGLRHIANWANRYGHFVRPGDHAPATDARNRIIQDSESNAVKSLRDIAEAAIESAKPLTFTRNAAVAEAERTTREKVYEGEAQIGRVLVGCGMVKLGRVRIDKTKELVFGNPAAAQALKGLPEGTERNKRIRSFCVAWRDQTDL
ncbi:MAG: hypothetical protein CSA72_02835 [Rhodobacterales bacterium]|nr:MAG: hypothetical protein CSA72_02835 [Rhodobacterales bacterium]